VAKGVKITRLRFTKSHNVWLVGSMAIHCQPKVMDVESTVAKGISSLCGQGHLFTRGMMCKDDDE